MIHADTLAQPVKKSVTKLPFPHTHRQALVSLALEKGQATTEAIRKVTDIDPRTVQRILGRLRDDGWVNHTMGWDQRGKTSIWSVKSLSRWKRSVCPRARKIVAQRAGLSKSVKRTKRQRRA